MPPYTGWADIGDMTFAAWINMSTPPSETRMLLSKGTYLWNLGVNSTGHIWWNNGDAAMPSVPRDAFWSWGVFASFIIVVPSLDIVAARAGGDWSAPQSRRGYRVVEPFLNAIVAAAHA